MILIKFFVGAKANGERIAWVTQLDFGDYNGDEVRTHGAAAYFSIDRISVGPMMALVAKIPAVRDLLSQIYTQGLNRGRDLASWSVSFNGTSPPGP